MSNYHAPVKEMNFVLDTVAGIDRVYKQEKFEESNQELVASVLDEAAKFASGVLAPLNTVGDLIGSKIVDNHVREASGFGEAYQKFADAGWTSLPCDPEFGGMGLPESVGIATMEMWSAANVSFALCPMLGQGAIEALQSHASDALRTTYLEKMIMGQWTGTMNLTESQAGSDLSVIKTTAKSIDDHYLINGNKIFITWGDHQMTENIIHLVLARVEGAPTGVRGISLFLVPKVLVNENGSLGEHNDVYAVSVEHKMGIHGSPTCVMSYGENSDGAVGYLVGEENKGLTYMFTMMNNARLNVGIEGVALSDRAYQKAVSYAQERIQGNPPGEVSAAPIIQHPDVKRMLMLMRALTEGSRALCYLTAVNFDLGHSGDAGVDKQALIRAELLTPLAKAWSTEISQEVTSLGVQIHGGMGFIEETGAAQFMRDARITTIYEGTSGIQANDFIGRKMIRDQGVELANVLTDIKATLLGMSAYEQFSNMATMLEKTTQQLDDISTWILQNHSNNDQLAPSAAFNFLMGTGTCIAGWLMAKAALAAQENLASDEKFYNAKIVTSQFFSAHVMPRAEAYFSACKSSNDNQLILSVDDF